jgi:hypothetical protein
MQRKQRIIICVGPVLLEDIIAGGFIQWLFFVWAMLMGCTTFTIKVYFEISSPTSSRQLLDGYEDNSKEDSCCRGGQ